MDIKTLPRGKVIQKMRGIKENHVNGLEVVSGKILVKYWFKDYFMLSIYDCRKQCRKQCPWSGASLLIQSCMVRSSMDIKTLPRGKANQKMRGMKENHVNGLEVWYLER